MATKVFYLLLVILFILLLVSAWLFLPYQSGRFEVDPNGNHNFSLFDYGREEMQFYKNMRFPDSRISYKIDNCALQKVNDMEEAFDTISDLTVLEFYRVVEEQEVTVTCKERTVIEGDLFIAGEGGPTRIVPGQNFNVILNGDILLLRDSNCATPNVGIHELLHVLGFNHSDNQNNIMYPISECGQTIGYDTIELLNEIYSVPSHPELSLYNVSALTHGRYIDLNFSVQNQGLQKSIPTKVNIYADDKKIKDIDIKSLDIGQGMIFSLTNIGVTQISIGRIKLEIAYAAQELDKTNNVALLKIK